MSKRSALLLGLTIYHALVGGLLLTGGILHQVFVLRKAFGPGLQPRDPTLPVLIVIGLLLIGPALWMLITTPKIRVGEDLLSPWLASVILTLVLLGLMLQYRTHMAYWLLPLAGMDAFALFFLRGSRRSQEAPQRKLVE